MIISHLLWKTDKQKNAQNDISCEHEKDSSKSILTLHWNINEHFENVDKFDKSRMQNIQTESFIGIPVIHFEISAVKQIKSMNKLEIKPRATQKV